MKISRKMYDDYVKYQKWVEKMDKKGMRVDERSRMYAESIEEFAQRYKDLSYEYHNVKKFDNTILNEMKARSFEGGTPKQLKAWYATLDKGMKDLLKTDPDLYNQLNEKYGFDKINKDELVFGQRKYGNLITADNKGLFNMLYYDILNNSTVKISFVSP